MFDVTLIRADDHLVLGVRWTNCTVAPGGPPMLLAGPGARLVVTLPPQHVGEEASPVGAVAPATIAVGGVPVPVWRGELSSPTRLVFELPVGARVPLDAEGVLAAMATGALLVPGGPPGPDDTAVELPYRLVVAPRGASGRGVALRHPLRPDDDSPSVWRTRLVDAGLPPATSLLDAGLVVRAVDEETAGRTDPPAITGVGNGLPLARADRLAVCRESRTTPAQVRRLELSTLGGTLDARLTATNVEWEHHAAWGRDRFVRTLSRGVLYPLGHRAQYMTVSERVYDADGTATLRMLRTLTVVEAVRPAPPDGPVRRAFPLGDVEITRGVYTDLADPQLLSGLAGHQTHFWPTTARGARIRFPVTLHTATGPLDIEVPLLFVRDLRPAVDSLTSTTLARRLAEDYGSVTVDIPATALDLVGAAAEHRSPGDIHEVRSMTIGGVQRTADAVDGYRCALTHFVVGLPALRALLDQEARATVRFAEKYVRDGVDDVLLHIVGANAVPIDFTRMADRCGALVSPRFVTNAISRTLGPVDRFALPDPATLLIDPATLFPSDDAALLGIPLRLLLRRLTVPPQLTAIARFAAAPTVTMSWRDVEVASAGPLRSLGTRLNLMVTTSPDHHDVDCSLSRFALELPPGSAPVLTLTFASLRFHQRDRGRPQLDVGDVTARFGGDLSIVKDLADAVDLGRAGRLVDVTPTGLTAHYALPVPSIATGAFTMRNMMVTTSITVPFTGAPTSVTLGFASRVSPFQLGVLMFGGGGYLELALDRDGLTRCEASLEFGAFVAVDFVVARGEVHALGGVRFVLGADGAVTVTGYLRIGGSVQVLGLISVSVELCLSMTYHAARNALVGRATLIIEIDLTLWSDTVGLDSGEWVIAGDRARHDALSRAPRSDAAGLQAWRDYRGAFAAVSAELDAVDRETEPQ